MGKIRFTHGKYSVFSSLFFSEGGEPIVADRETGATHTAKPRQKRTVMFWGVEVVSEGRLFYVEVQFVLCLGPWRLPSPSLGSEGGPSPFEGGSPRHFDSDAQAVSKTQPFQAPPPFPRQARHVSVSAEYSWEAILGYPGYRGPMGSEIHFW